MDRIRLVLFGILFVALVGPFFVKTKIKVTPSPEVKAAYDFVENLPNGCKALFSVDYGPSSQPETHPMVVAMARQLLRKDCKIAIMTLQRFEGIMMGNDVMAYVSNKIGAEYGEDWVMLGFRPGVVQVLTNIGTDFKSVFDRDVKGTPLTDIDWLKDVKTVKDFHFVAVFTASATGDWWVTITGARYNIPIIIGSTAVVAPSLYPYYQSGQIKGIIGGLRGAADYEYLVNSPDMAMTGMLAQTGGHVVILIFILIGNILYFFGWERRR